MSGCFLMSREQFVSYIMVRTSYDDEACFVLDQQVGVEFCNTNSLNQQLASLRRIILIPSQPDFAHTPYNIVYLAEIK